MCNLDIKSHEIDGFRFYYSTSSICGRGNFVTKRHCVRLSSVLQKRTLISLEFVNDDLLGLLMPIWFYITIVGFASRFLPMTSPEKYSSSAT